MNLNEAAGFVDRMIGILEIQANHNEDKKELVAQIKSAGLQPASITKAARLKMASQDKRQSSCEEMRTTLALVEG